MDKKREIFLLVGAVVVVVLVYFLFFYNSGNINSKSNSQNAINIFYNSCDSCSNSAINIIYKLFSLDKSILKAENISFNSSEGNSIVSNYSITALPTILINETNNSENVLDSLVYLNIFNIEGNKFVLNTPFLAGLTKGITYFDLIQGYVYIYHINCLRKPFPFYIFKYLDYTFIRILHTFVYFILIHFL